MAQKKYRVSPKCAPFIRSGEFKFTVPYDKNYGTPPLHVVTRGLPVITVPNLGAVVTTNEWTQKALELMIVPQNTMRNGEKHPAGNLFEDITGTGVPVDLDLDTILT